LPTAAELASAFGLLTRLPLPRGASAASVNGSPGASVWAWPVVGAVIGVIGAAGYALAWWGGLSSLLAGLVAVILMVVATGGFHEDGLADTADGIGGGGTPEKRLLIMKDSRIGSFGALALIASVGLRAGALGQLADPRLVAPAVIAAAVLGRAAMPGVVLLSSPARPGGLGAALGALDLRRVAVGGGLAVLLCLILGRPHAMLEAIFATLLVLVAMAGLGARSLGGYTGDTLGATEQLAECAVLLTLAGAMR
jgi:adenosylcobinamide-GDP ribazoletransferase